MHLSFLVNDAKKNSRNKINREPMRTDHAIYRDKSASHSSSNRKLYATKTGVMNNFVGNKKETRA